MEQQFVLSNGLMERVLSLEEGGLRTISLKNLADGNEFIHTPVREFAFAADDVLYSSYTSKRLRIVDGNKDVCNGVPVLERVCQETSGDLALSFRIGPVRTEVFYHLGTDVCASRKFLKITNLSDRKIRLSNVIFDDTCCAPGEFADCDLYAGNADHPQSLCFTLEGAEDMITCHNEKRKAGWIMGSTAPGVLRYFLFYPNWNNAINALNMSSAPFAKYLAQGEGFTTPSSLLALYHGERSSAESCHDFRTIVREGLPVFSDREKLMYCTWIPFLKNINEALTMDLAKQASKIGFGYFVLDDGYFTDENRAVDPAKFPEGLSRLSDCVRSQGMTFGLWLNVGTDYGMKNVDPAFYALRSDHKINRLGFDYSSAHNIFCFGSSYREYILEYLDHLATQYHVGYFKLDFSHVASPYGISSWGCHSTEHTHHRGWEDSFYAIYEGMSFLRDEMKKRHPELILDFSFEAFGTERPNIAALELSTLHHVTNTNGEDPSLQNITKIRKNFYMWLGKLPPERILNGLLALGTEDSAEYLLTSFTGAPLLAGDLRKLAPEIKTRLALFAKEFNEAAENGPLTECILVENKTDTDGFLRLNSAGSGIGCFFNRSAKEYTFVPPEGLRFCNVETNSTTLTVPAEGCALFRVEPQ